MQYRFLKDVPVSILGFGCMRLPTRHDEPLGMPHIEKSIKMIRHGIDSGINYLDSSKLYTHGLNEKIVGMVIRDGYRDRVKIATKLPPRKYNSTNEAERIFQEQRNDLDVDRIDVYLLHSLNAGLWDHLKKINILSWLEEKRRSGQIAFAGFSFHDSLDVFKDILDSFDWDLCQIQYNYIGENFQAGRAGLEYAASKGIPVVVMEPLFGGALANPPKPVAALFDENGMNPVDLALRWIWDRHEVLCVLSGMSDIRQVDENIAVARNIGVPALTDTERKILEDAKRLYFQTVNVPCTACAYCMPCTIGIDIPSLFDLYNRSAIEINWARGMYDNVDPHRRADACIGCGSCSSKCPQGIDIEAMLRSAHDVLRRP